jgi:hypothetical protein
VGTVLVSMQIRATVMVLVSVLMIFIERDLIPKEDKGDYNHV